MSDVHSGARGRHLTPVRPLADETNETEGVKDP